MASFLTLVLSTGCLFVAVTAHSAPRNIVEDAKYQEGKLLRCWELIDINNPAAGYGLSDPLYPFCSHMSDPRSFDQFFVNGVTESSDDYGNIKNMFKDTNELQALLSICLQEAFAFNGPQNKAVSSIRCLCKRSGCNIPRPMVDFLEFNKKIVPQVA